MIEVQCRCGDVELHIEGDPISQVYCHCRDCQTAHDAAYCPNAVYPADAVRIVRGTLATLIVRTTPRLRCSSCGTALFTEVNEANLRSLNAYLLPDGLFSPQCHLHCQDALLPVADGLPHYSDLPAAFGGTDAVVDW